MRRPTTPTSQTQSRKASPAVSARGTTTNANNNSTRPKSPVAGSSTQQQQPLTEYQKLTQQLNIRNFAQVSRSANNNNNSSSGNAFSTPQHPSSHNNNNVINHPSYPPPMLHQRSPRVPAGSTPNSARSASCINDLEGVINEVMQQRMQSLAESRKRVEELAEMQRKETEIFLSSMEHILASSTVASTAQHDMMEDYEERLTKEKSEKGRMLDILQRFKAEGDRVTSDLKRALFDEREKHKEAHWKNEQLSGKIKELQNIVSKYQQQIKELQLWKQQAQSTSHNNHHYLGQQSTSQKQQENSSSSGMNEQQIAQLVEILREHERVIDELERRNRNLEHDLRYHQNVKTRLMNNNNNNGMNARDGSVESLESIQIPDSIPEMGDSPTSGSNNDLSSQQQENINNNNPSLNALIQQYSRDLGFSMTNTNLSQLVKGLLNQVRNENRIRLRVEEQYTKLVTDQDNQIRRLEGKLRDYENIMANAGVNVSTSGNSKTFVGSPSPARITSNSSKAMMSPPQNNNNNYSNAANNRPRQQPGGVVAGPTSSTTTSGPRLPTLTGTNSNTGSNQNSGTNTPRTSSILQGGSQHNQQRLQQPKRQAVIGLEQHHQQILEDEDIPPSIPPPPATTRSTNNNINYSNQHPHHDERHNNGEEDDEDFEPAQHRSSTKRLINSAVPPLATAAVRQSSESQSRTNNNKAGSVSSDLPSLEDQLNAVTNDFNQSLDMWNKAAAAGTPKQNLAGSDEDEFQPAN